MLVKKMCARWARPVIVGLVGVLLVAVAVVAAPPAVAATVPGAPTAVTAEPGEWSITLTWEPPVDDGGSPITEYSICYTDGGCFNHIFVGADARSYTYTAHHGGTPQRPQVVAVNAVGRSVPGFPPQREVWAGAPSAVQDLQVQALPDGAFRVSWLAADGHGDPPWYYNWTLDGVVDTVGLDARAWDSDAAATDPDLVGSYTMDLVGLDWDVPHRLTLHGSNARGNGIDTTRDFFPGRRSELRRGEGIWSGDGLVSPNGRYRLDVQTDGNLVSYGPGGRPLWDTRTWGRTGSRITFQEDGNIVLLAETWDGRAEQVSWNTNTWASSTDVLRMQDDGNLVLYDRSGNAVWASGWDRGPGVPQDTAWAHRQFTDDQTLVAPNGVFRMVVQRDGNAVVYRMSQPYYWHTGTWGRPGTRLVMQSDGNLVAYDPWRRPLWNSATWGNRDARLVMQNDGNLVIYAADGRPLWSSLFGRTY